MERLLVIDDDRELCDLVTEYLGASGYEVDAAYDGDQGAARALTGGHALIILDVMLPGMNGFDVLRRIRRGSDTPVLMLTARGDEIDRIVGLELGADDYLPKPFNPRELQARIKAILRRTSESPGQAIQGGESKLQRIGDIELDPGARIVRRGGELIELTTAEFDLLRILLSSAGHVVTREELFQTVLDREPAPLDRSIDMHVSNLRKKLGHHNGVTERIKSVRGVGYIYTLPSASADG